jgi:hypothetical protein
LYLYQVRTKKKAQAEQIDKYIYFNWAWGMGHGAWGMGHGA